MNGLLLKIISGMSAAAIGASSFTGVGTFNQNMTMPEGNRQMMGSQMQNQRENNKQPQNSMKDTQRQNSGFSPMQNQMPQNNGIDMFRRSQPQELIREGFVDNGLINKELPEIKGNTNNPRPDNEMIDEITSSDGLEQSEDYSYVYLLGEIADNEYEALKTYIDVTYDDCSWVMDSLSSNGWEIVLTSADLDMLLFDGSTDGVTGATVFADKTIYIEAGEYEYCVVHEIGHYLDYINSFVSTQSEFTQIYNEEGSNLSEYGSTDRLEFFAEVFMYGILEENTTASKVPQAYEFIENLKAAS